MNTDPYNVSDMLLNISTEDKVLIVLRGLPGCGSDNVAQLIMKEAVLNGVKSVAIIGTEDYFRTADGYKFEQLMLAEYHKRNFDRACLHFLASTQIVVLNNYNIKKQHYRHYVRAAKDHRYSWQEYIIGNPTEMTDVDLQNMIKDYKYKVPLHVMQRYSEEFELI